MGQLDKLKTIVYQLIGENKFIVDALEYKILRENVLPSIELSDMRGSEYWPDNVYTIRLGVPDIIRSLKISKRWTFDLVYRFKIINLYSEYEYRQKNCFGIILNLPMGKDGQKIVEEQLKDSDFLKETKVTLCEVLTIYSFAYSLYHEMGHFLLDKFIPQTRPLCRECAADNFAFEALKSMKSTEEDEVLLLGAIIGIINVLDIRTPEEEKKDTKHPHSIERLYALLDYWKISDDSPCWRYSFDEVYNWCLKHNISITWMKETSITYKDKFTDAYSHFRKDLQ